MLRKNNLSLFIKVLIGIGSLMLIAFKLRQDLTSERLDLLSHALVSGTGLACLSVCLLLIPVNWGIESKKWQLLTRPVEHITYLNASRSVYSGVCLGNLAPGRATEFVAKVLFFSPENRPQVSILHFVGGTFQLSVTILCGLTAGVSAAQDKTAELGILLWIAAGGGILILSALAFSIFRIDVVLKFIIRKFSKRAVPASFSFAFTPVLVLQIFSLSVIRYFVFATQFLLILKTLSPDLHATEVIAEVCLFFLVSTAIPMISFLEAAIKAVIAMIVFHNTGLSNVELALTAFLIWFINIIIPSIAGYIFLVQHKFDFKLFRQRS